MRLRSASAAPARRRARPGPGPTPAAILRGLDLTVRRRIDSLVAGEHRSPALGHGTEIAQVRPYQLGDDVRQIDWAVTARTREPHVRVHVAERTLTTWLLLDVSASMGFGTADRRKADVAEGAALAIGHLATRQGNRLGVMTFGAHSAEVDPAAAGPPGADAADARAALDARAGRRRARPTWPTRCARAGRLARQRGLVIVVSDFRGPHDWRTPLMRLLNRHHVIAVEVRDPREQELPAVGDLWLVDPETGPPAARRHQPPQAPRALRGARRGRARGAGARAAPHRRRAHRALDLRRLAARAGAPHEPPHRAEAPVSFELPIALLGLLLVPLVLLLYLVSQRRRRRYAVRFTNLDLLGSVVTELARDPPPPPAAAVPARARGADASRSRART